MIDRQFGTTDVFIYFPLSGIDARYKRRFGLAASRGLSSSFDRLMLRQAQHEEMAR